MLEMPYRFITGSIGLVYKQGRRLTEINGKNSESGKRWGSPLL